MNEFYLQPISLHFHFVENMYQIISTETDKRSYW